MVETPIANGSRIKPELLANRFLRNLVAPDRLPPNLVASNRFLSDRFLPNRLPPNLVASNRFLPNRFLPDRFPSNRFLPNRFLPDRFPSNRFLPNRFLPDRFPPNLVVPPRLAVCGLPCLVLCRSSGSTNESPITGGRRFRSPEPDRGCPGTDSCQQPVCCSFSSGSPRSCLASSSSDNGALPIAATQRADEASPNQLTCRAWPPRTRRPLSLTPRGPSVPSWHLDAVGIGQVCLAATCH